MKMPEKHLYDTRFFMEYFYTADNAQLSKLKHELMSTKEKMVSVLTIHEMYRIDLRYEGREVAALRSSIIKADFKIIDVNFQTAVQSAELRIKHQMPMADSVIAATAQIYGCTLVTDDSHFKGIANLKTKWV
jgi:predicted nucleic acid-binding protein